MIPSLPPADELLDLLPDGVCVVDGEGRLLYVNRSFERILGYNRDEMLGLRVFDLVHTDDHAATTEEAARVTAGAFQHHFRNRYLHKAGHYVDIQWSARGHAECGVRIGLAREVTQLRRAERELEHRATHDPLTGLANRDYLHIELCSALEHARVSGDRLALLFMDLDGFKAVNDSAGHHRGDCVLREVASRLKQGLRQTDLVARFGGDEFVVLLRGCHDAATAGRVADELRTRLSGVPLTGMDAYRLDASIGIACFPEHGGTVEALLAYADRAMYAVKRQRASSVHAVAATGQASSA
jgi:diguanylate cyclase (GGDEF)-like protein/PAS domain S-box-containing protein